MESKYVECRKFKVTVISAYDVEDVRSTFKLKVYAKIKIGSDSDTVRQTQTDESNEKNPYWNCSSTYTITEAGLQNPKLKLAIKLYAARSLSYDKYIAQVSTSIKGLLEGGSSSTMTLPLVNKSRNATGSLTFSYEFGEPIHVKRLSFIKKVVNVGAHALVDVGFQTLTGGLISFPLEVKIFTEEDIVDKK